MQPPSTSTRTSIGSSERETCSSCARLFKSKHALDQHVKAIHNFDCISCRRHFKSAAALSDHTRDVHGGRLPAPQQATTPPERVSQYSVQDSVAVTRSAPPLHQRNANPRANGNDAARNGTKATVTTACCVDSVSQTSATPRYKTRAWVANNIVNKITSRSQTAALALPRAVPTLTAFACPIAISSELLLPPYCLVDTATVLAAVVDALSGLPTQPPSIYIDLEGVNLSRHGSISILQLHVLPTRHTYLIDIYTLRGEAFTTHGLSVGQTLGALLESPDIPKVFFDVRNDSDALHAHFGIRLGGIQDLQLMELATRKFARRTVKSLVRCIEQDSQLTLRDRTAWMKCKDDGVRLFLPERGGSYEVFDQRPLSAEILRYCVQDVHLLPRLWTRYDRKMTKKWWWRVGRESAERVRSSQSSDYVSHGKDKALAPKSWRNL
ncbi:uncharacterized protein LMH87_007718 [Akanthomyces muscarius]|uniref:C2H2-type domain-containing protein n=1 Tax=Akanthomyces muscarius TaxID=2231603 RepID=A0A9W8URL2_AKAMU|nr:uncharacterized protein LMH87_007718 [Akanthomyces muscarius]KAJ4161695.1 hypothetical protein LMH87_007718 [Akanthomyces muscarius]